MKIFKKDIYILGNRPQTDWRRVFASAVILAIGFSIYGYIFYRQTYIESGDLEVPVIAIGQETSNQTGSVQGTEKGTKLELNQIIELYLQKKEHFEKIMTELKKS